MKALRPLPRRPRALHPGDRAAASARAARRRDKRQALQAADEALEELRLLLRQGQALDLLTVGQYAHVVRLTDEVGRLLGGWRKSQARAASGDAASDE
jgi:hypothetical protein